MIMGFDAPPGTGDPRNRERINIVADSDGGAYIRFLNRKTYPAGFLRLDEKDQFHLEFVDVSQGKVRRRQLGPDVISVGLKLHAGHFLRYFRGQRQRTGIRITVLLRAKSEGGRSLRRRG